MLRAPSLIAFTIIPESITMASSNYDHIIVGGGLSGCVLASRLRQYKPGSGILLIEAGQDTRSRTDILRPDILNLGGELDWMYPTEPQASLGGRSIVYNAGKGLGGGTLINSGKFPESPRKSGRASPIMSSRGPHTFLT